MISIVHYFCFKLLVHNCNYMYFLSDVSNLRATQCKSMENGDTPMPLNGLAVVIIWAYFLNLKTRYNKRLFLQKRLVVVRTPSLILLCDH